MTLHVPRIRTMAAATAAALALSLVTAVVPAVASASEEQNVVSPDAVSDSLAGVNSSLLLDSAADGGVGRQSLGAGSVDVPVDPAEGVTFSSPSAKPLVVDLPGADKAGDASVLADGTVTYPAKGFSNSVIVGDIGVQMLTTIGDASAPTSFEYEVSLEPGQSLKLVHGGAAVFNADGSVAISVAAPWAVDANGNPVPTRYGVEGSTLVQLVDHTASASVAYPVVADPIWLAPWVLRCLAGIGLNQVQIAKIASSGSPGAVLAAFGYGAFRCIIGR